jgi:hypothetical protein
MDDKMKFIYATKFENQNFYIFSKLIKQLRIPFFPFTSHFRFLSTMRVEIQLVRI